jgi:hypothetical protein
MTRLLTLAALFGAGVLVAGVVATVGSAQTTPATTTETIHQTTTQTVQQTSTAHETTTVQQTTTAPATTVVTTATVPRTHTTPTTTSTASASGGTPTWVWVLLAALAAAVIGLIVYLLTHRGAAFPDSERRRLLDGAIQSWTTQGWALLSETNDSAMLQRGNERMTISVDAAGQINTRAMTTQPPAQPPEQPTQQLPDQPTQQLPEQPPEQPPETW